MKPLALLALVACPIFAQTPYWWTALHAPYATPDELAQVTFPQAPAPVAQPVAKAASVPEPIPADRPAAPCSKPSSFYAAGASYNRASRPNLAGLFVVAVPLTCSANSFQVYSFTEHNLVPVGAGSNLSFKDTTSSGFATPLKQVGPFNIFAFGNIGVTTATATPTTSGNVSLEGAYGFLAAFPLWKRTSWTGIVAAQKVAGNNVYSILFGRSW